MDNIKNKKLFLLDMDGTIYLDDDLFEGVLEFLEHIKNIGGKYMFLTNNSSKSVDKYIEKLEKLGIKSTADDFLTSTNATILFLKKKNHKKIYALGTQSFKEQLKAASLPVTDKLEDGIDCLCMGFDTELTFKKLEDACILLREDIDYIATNPDWVCPTWYGFVPDCGSVSEMINLAIEKSGFKKEEAIIFGDRLYTDIASGVNAGITTVFVLSGEGTLKDMEESDKKPTYVYENIKKFYEDLIK